MKAFVEPYHRFISKIHRKKTKQNKERQVTQQTTAYMH